jgi:hypothetical protein
MAIVRTNPAFAHLAYRRSIVVALVDELRENYMALSGDEPKKSIICPDVLQEDATVPEDEYLNVIEELELEAENLRLELMKFQFTKKESNGLLSRTEDEEASEGDDQAGSRKGRKKRRRTR